MISVHSQEEKIDILGNFYWCEFHVFPKMMKNSIFDLENGGSTYTRVNTVHKGDWRRITNWGNLNELPPMFVRCLIGQVATMNHEKGGRHKSF